MGYNQNSEMVLWVQAATRGLRPTVAVILARAIHTRSDPDRVFFRIETKRIRRDGQGLGRGIQQAPVGLPSPPIGFVIRWYCASVPTQTRQQLTRFSKQSNKVLTASDCFFRGSASKQHTQSYIKLLQSRRGDEYRPGVWIPYEEGEQNHRVSNNF